jgi:hypothetical protein
MEKVHELIAGAGGNGDPETVGKIVNLLRTEDGMFSVEVRVTGNYYLGAENESPAAYIFTSEEYAKEWALRVRDTGLTSRVVRIAPDQRIGFFSDLRRSGFKTVCIDAGHEMLTLSLFSIIKKPTEEKAVENPSLLLMANQFYQAVAEHRATRQMQSLLTRELYDATYLVPCDKDDSSRHPMIGRNTGEHYFPVFTDLPELMKFDRKHQFTAAETDIEGLKKLAKKCDGVVINPLGFNLMLDYEKAERIVSENGDRANLS